MASTLTFSGLNWAKRHKRSFDAVLSMHDPNSKQRLVYHQRPANVTHRSFAFDDCEFYTPQIPTVSRAQAADILAFGRAHAHHSLLIHCFHGVGRSAAVALALLYDRMDTPDAHAACAALQSHRSSPDPDVAPNLMLLYHFDALMGGNTGLVQAAIDTVGTGLYIYRAQFYAMHFALAYHHDHEAVKAFLTTHPRPFGDVPPTLHADPLAWSLTPPTP